MSLLGLFDSRTTQYYREQYYGNHLNIAHVADLERILDINSHNRFHSEQPILFKDLEMGASRKEIVKLLGRPRFTKRIHEEGEGAFEVMMYKAKIDQKRVLIQVNCVNDQLMVASYSYTLLTTHELSELQNETMLTYIPDHIPENFRGDTHFVIEDPNQNKIYAKSNLFNLKLFYINADEELRKKIRIEEEQQKSGNSPRFRHYLNSIFMNL